MQISKLYETKLECSSYNVNIDSTDTTVTLTLVDFNGSPVTNTAVTLKADKGYFTKAVGKTTTTYTDASATKTINATTDNNGKVVATWTASEWGLCTFSANNSTIQCLVKGMKKIKTSTNNVLRLYRNDNVMTLACISNSDDVYFAKDDWVTYSEGFIPSDLVPRSSLVATNTEAMDCFWLINYQGDVKKRTTRSSNVQNVKSYSLFTWSIAEGLIE